LQESTSEAVNAYYGLYLLGKARGTADLTDWGRVLLAMEMRSAQRYWHVTTADAPQVYPQPFAANKVVGVLWNSLVRSQVDAWPYIVKLNPCICYSGNRPP
jgi:endo-1,3(4)-beta-glucanase